MISKVKMQNPKNPFPVCKWAQRDHMIMLTIPLQKFKYHKLQITDEKLWFLAVTSELVPNNIYEIDLPLLHKVDPAKSGMKIGA